MVNVLEQLLTGILIWSSMLHTNFSSFMPLQFSVPSCVMLPQEHLCYSRTHYIWTYYYWAHNISTYTAALTFLICLNGYYLFVLFTLLCYNIKISEKYLQYFLSSCCLRLSCVRRRQEVNSQKQDRRVAAALFLLKTQLLQIHTLSWLLMHSTARKISGIQEMLSHPPNFGENFDKNINFNAKLYWRWHV